MNILLITAHPDDEVIWLGSTLYELSKLENVNIYCICLWGILEKPGSMRSVTPGYKDIDRKEQFYEVSKAMNFKGSYIITETTYEVKQQELQKSEVIENEFLNALNKINLKIDNINLLITHSYYGDERKHPHHIRLYDFFSEYTLSKTIPFGFFSILKVPNIPHIPILTSTIRKNELHILSIEKIVNQNLKIVNKPEFLIEFQGNLTKKLEILKLYKAVDFNKHYNDYTGFSIINEKLYVTTKGFEMINNNIVNRLHLVVKNIL